MFVGIILQMVPKMAIRMAVTRMTQLNTVSAIDSFSLNKCK
jgi:hypothetical protein